MKSDESLQLKVAHQINQDPLLRDVRVVVEIVDRQITIYGTVNKFFKKALIWNIARKTTGIKNIIDQTEVQLPNPNQFHDAEIANAIVEKLQKNLGTSYKNIEVTVTKGKVILAGALKWEYQKILATDCISFVDGIVAIQNKITMAAQPEPTIGEKDIFAAIYKEELITSDIGVDLTGHRVILSGNVPTSFQKKLVEKIVRDLPGVDSIENRLKIFKNKPTNS